MKNKKKILGFTFVELIVVSTIVIILGTLGFFSYSKYSTSSRDTKRVSDIKNISSSLNLYKQKRGYIPLPGDIFILKNGVIEISFQGKLNEKVSLTSIDTIPLDPLIKIPYSYSITKNKQEFQLGATLENNGNPIALLEGNYQTVSKNILPSIMIAYNGSGSVDITQNSYKNKFILNKTKYNLPYSIETGIPVNNPSISFSGILEEPNKELIQNTSFKSCDEIYDAKKSIGDGEYQILDEDGNLKEVSCVFIALGTTKTAFCGEKPDYTDRNTSPNYTQIWDGANWLPIKTVNYNINPSAEDCRFKCNTNYTWNGSACVASTQIGTCTGLPATDASWNTASSITQTWNGSAWTPSITGTYNISPSTSECRFKCNTNYTWNGSACVANNQTGTCTGLPATNASWNTVSSITQTWNGSAWTPSITGTYNISPSTSECRFKCNTNYTWNGSACVASTQTGACTGLPATNASWNTASSITQTWNGSAWTPSTTGTYNISPSTSECRFKCNTGYTWDGDSCELGGWTLIDTNCNKPDILIGSQVWAGCNSTLGSPSKTYSGDANGTNVASFNWGPSQAYTGSIYGKMYTKTEATNMACGTGRRPATDNDFLILEQALGCINYNDTGVRCAGLGWSGHTSKNITNNIIQALGIPLAGSCSSLFNCSNRNTSADLWTSTTGTYDRYFSNISTSVDRSYHMISSYSFSVRCIKQ